VPGESRGGRMNFIFCFLGWDGRNKSCNVDKPEHLICIHFEETNFLQSLICCEVTRHDVKRECMGKGRWDVLIHFSKSVSFPGSYFNFIS
jgi:hypothetical protein